LRTFDTIIHDFDTGHDCERRIDELKDV